MSYELRLAGDAVKALSMLPAEVQEDLLDVLEMLATDPDPDIGKDDSRFSTAPAPVPGPVRCF